MRRWVEAKAEMSDERVLLLDGYDEAILGVWRDEEAELRAVYDETALITLVMDRDDVDWATAAEWVAFNVHGVILVETPEDPASPG